LAYILDLINGVVQPQQNRITLERFLLESAYITKYLSRVVKDQPLVVYHVLFYLSWFESGKGSVVVPLAKIGSFIMSTQGNIIDDTTTVRRRLPPLIQKQCISIVRQRGDANEIWVYLPSDIPECRALIDQGESWESQALQPDERDYYTNPERRLEILERDTIDACTVQSRYQKMHLCWTISFPCQVSEPTGSGILLQPVSPVTRGSRMGM
jgi:hypothetical protein